MRTVTAIAGGAAAAACVLAGCAVSSPSGPHVIRKRECTSREHNGCPPGAYSTPVWLLYLSNGSSARVSRSTYDSVRPGTSEYDPAVHSVIAPEEAHPAAPVIPEHPVVEDPVVVDPAR